MTVENNRVAPNTTLILITALLGALAVFLGAFAAHGLSLPANRLGWYASANRYHFYHTLALLVIAFLPYARSWLTTITICWVGGVILFSGSLYYAAIMNVTDWLWLTPIGGVGMLAGWVILMICAFIHRVSR